MFDGHDLTFDGVFRLINLDCEVVTVPTLENFLCYTVY